MREQYRVEVYKRAKDRRNVADGKCSRSPNGRSVLQHTHIYTLKVTQWS